jgi:methylmalonyl-CoA mutase cobalamin-binding subunit
MAETIPTQRTRRPKPRSTEVVIGALEERVNCIVLDGLNEAHVLRISELIAELRRSLNGSKGEESSE